MFGGIPSGLVKILISNFDECIFNPSNDKTVAKSFKFAMFKPYANILISQKINKTRNSFIFRRNGHVEYIDGADLLNGCSGLKFSAKTVTKTIWLWPGWLSNCRKVDEIVSNFS